MSTPDFQPDMQIITAITQAQRAAVTTSAVHSFDDGESVRIYVPKTYGMHIDYALTNIEVTGATSFTCDLDTSNMDPFIIPVLGTFTPAQCVAVSGLHDNIATM